MVIDKNKEIKSVDFTRADVMFKEFWRDSLRFADLFNGVLFHGKQVIQADDLMEGDTDVSGVLESEGYRESLQRTRDIVKKTAYGTQFVLLGIENQIGIHYAMPLRTMVYDAMGYVKEVKEIGTKRSNEKIKMTTDEFLSNFGRSNTITPIITIVVYYGKKSWDGPLSLTDMMPELPSEIKGYVSDYKMNLVEVLETNAKHFHQEDVMLFFAYTQAFIKKEHKVVAKLNAQYNVSKEVAYLVGKITNGNKLVQIIQNSREDYTMCEYLDELWDDGKKEGMQLKLTTQIIKKVKKHKSIEVIAEELECEIGEISELYEIIQTCGNQCEPIEVMAKIKNIDQ